MVTELRSKHDAMEVEMAGEKTAMKDAEQHLQQAIAAAAVATQDHNHFKDVLTAHRSDLETQKAHAVALVSRNEHIGALSQCAAERTAAREASWRKWEDRLGASDALSTFEDADLALLLILLGRCGWIEAFKQHGLAAGMLQTVTVAELKLVRGTCRLPMCPLFVKALFFFFLFFFLELKRERGRRERDRETVCVCERERDTHRERERERERESARAGSNVIIAVLVRTYQGLLRV